MNSKALAGTGLLIGLLFITTISIAQIPQKPLSKPLENRLPQRPSSPIDLHIIKRGADYLRLAFTDISENELGNRLYRSTDRIHWNLLGELGIVTKGHKKEYTDANLAHTSLYYYKVEVYARPQQPVRKTDTMVNSYTPVLAAYTGEGDSVRLFRLQIFFKTANLPGADLDGPLRVDVGINRGWASRAKDGDVWVAESDYTFLNYGHDDFEKGSEFSYELITKNVLTLDQLGDIKISNGTWSDAFIFEKVKIIANNNVIYEKSYGAAGHKMVGLGTLVIPFNEVASSTPYRNFVAANRNSLIPPGLDATLDQTTVTWTVKIPKAEIRSRIESIIGHSFAVIPSMGDNLEWDESRSAVTVYYKTPDSLHIDLDLRITAGPDRNVDVDFDIALKYTCDQRNRLKLVFTPCNITKDPHFDFLNGLIPPLNVLLKVAYTVAARFVDDPGLDSIETIFDLPTSLNCGRSKCMFTPEGDLLIMVTI